MAQNRFKGFACAGILRIALTLAVISSAGSSLGGSATITSAQGGQLIHVWAAISVRAPILETGDEIEVTFAATNLGTAPIAETAVREETVLVVNGKEWSDSNFVFSEGLHSGHPLAPGKSMMFGYGLTHLFTKPGLYRLVWKGKGFESLPFEFRVAEHPF